MNIRGMACALAVAGLIASPAALAQKYPEKAVRVIVPFAAGGGTDIIARMMAQGLADGWGQNVVVDNRPGGGTVIGAELVARSNPDGYTLLLTANPQSSNPALLPKLPYDTVRDFAPVTMVASAPLLLVVHPTLPVRTVRELITLARARPNQLTYASSGNGGPQHLAGELFKFMAGIVMLHVPYRGGAPAIADLLGGQVQLSFASLLTALPHIKSGKLRALGLSSVKRLASNPDIPTVAESGVPGFELVTWYGVFAPAATPRSVVSKIQGDMARVLASAEVRDRLARSGVQAVGNQPGEFRAYFLDEIEKVRKLVRAAVIKPD